VESILAMEQTETGKRLTGKRLRVKDASSFTRSRNGRMVENLHLWEGKLGLHPLCGPARSKLDFRLNWDNASLVPRGTVFHQNQRTQAFTWNKLVTASPRNPATISFNFSFKYLAAHCHTGRSGLSYNQEAIHANRAEPTDESVS